MTEPRTRITVTPDQERHLEVRRTARYVRLGGEGVIRDVWVCIHGYGQLARRFARDLGALVQPGRLVLVPEALNRFYQASTSDDHRTAPVGATWMTREDRETEIADYVAYLDALYAAEVAPHVANGARLTALGFSQGVTTTVRWCVLGQSHVDRLVCWAGALPHDVDLASHAASLAAMQPAVVIGDRDEFADWASVEAQVARLDAAKIAHTLHRFDGTHTLDDALLQELAAR